MGVLFAIESSCDETSVALLNSSGAVLGCWTRSQIQKHREFGGVVPEVAARDHLSALDPLVRLALNESGVALPDLDAIGVTRGPGLIGALLVGVQYARTLGQLLDIPVYGINHLYGHVLSIDLATDQHGGVPRPTLAVLVSGGHTLLLRVDEAGTCTRYGYSVDDAIGEAFDKTAKILGLPYPGGPSVMAAALRGNGRQFNLPRPMLNSGDGRISMSGLKTALVRVARDLGPHRLEAAVDDLCASFQEAVADVLVAKSRYAIGAAAASGKAVQSLVFTGGVAANQLLRERLGQVAKEEGLVYAVPPFDYCTDNAAMIGAAALVRWRRGDVGDTDLEPRNRWPLG